MDFGRGDFACRRTITGWPPLRRGDGDDPVGDGVSGDATCLRERDVDYGAAARGVGALPPSSGHGICG